MGCLNKLLSLIRKRKEHYPVVYLKPPTHSHFIIVPLQESPQAASEQNNNEIAPMNDEEKCEEPVPLQVFNAVNTEMAREKAAKKGLLILFKGYQRWDLFGRRKGFWALTPEFALKLLRLQTDIKSETEFTPEELTILRDLALKGWVKTLKNGGICYYGLNQKTAVILKKQLMNQTF